MFPKCKVLELATRLCLTAAIGNSSPRCKPRAAVDYGGMLDIDEGLLKQLHTRLISCYYYYYHMTCFHTFRQHELCNSTFIQTTGKVCILVGLLFIDCCNPSEILLTRVGVGLSVELASPPPLPYSAYIFVLIRYTCLLCDNLA